MTSTGSSADGRRPTADGRRGRVPHVTWEGYGAEGDTYEPPEHLPPALLRAFNTRYAKYPPSIDLVLRRTRAAVARKLLESKGALFGVQVDVPEASIPEYSTALLDIFASPPRASVRPKVVTKRAWWGTTRTLTIRDQAHAAWVASLGSVMPEHGVGALRIRGVTRASNMLMIACTQTAPLLITATEPKKSTEPGALPAAGKYTPSRSPSRRSSSTPTTATCARSTPRAQT